MQICAGSLAAVCPCSGRELHEAATAASTAMCDASVRKTGLQHGGFALAEAGINSFTKGHLGWSKSLTCTNDWDEIWHTTKCSMRT